MLGVENAMKPDHDTPQRAHDDQRGCGDQREQQEREQHEPPSR